MTSTFLKQKPKADFSSSQLFRKVIKNSMLWVLAVYSIIIIRATRNADPMEIRYPPPRIKLGTSEKYISSNFAASSRLGNHLFELCSLLSISRKLERKPVFFIQNKYYERMWQDSNHVIPGLMEQFLVFNGSIPKSVSKIVFHVKCCTFDDPSVLNSYDDEYIHLTGTHYQSWKYFSDKRNELIGSFKAADGIYKGLPRSDEDIFIACVHVRRGDFLSVGFHVADENFIKNALNYIIDQEEGKAREKMATVFFGDDVPFMEHLRGAIGNSSTFVSQNSAYDDLLYAKGNCNMVLITAAHSTYGWWMGYLSKGNKVYYPDIQFTNDYILETGQFNPEDYYLPHWIPLRNAGLNNSTVIRSY